MKKLLAAAAAALIIPSVAAAASLNPLTDRCSTIPFDPTKAPNPITAAMNLSMLSYWAIGFINGNIYGLGKPGGVHYSDANAQNIIRGIEAFCVSNPDEPAVAGVIHVAKGIVKR